MWYNKYIGIPYKDNGRDLDGVDCWGLVRLVYKNEYDIQLPSFAEQYLGASDVDVTKELIAINKENWQQSQNKTIGNVVLFRVLGNESHVGIYIGNNKFLHARQNHASAIESLNSVSWNKRVVGFYNYTEKSSIIVNGIPNPLNTQRYLEVMPEGITLKQIVASIHEKYKISNKLKSKIVVLLNGKLTEARDYERPLTKFDSVEYRLVPEGSNGLRSILMIAVVFAAVMAGQYYVAGQMSELAAASAAAGEVAATAVPMSVKLAAVAIQMGVNMVGMALVDAIAPIRMPTDNRQDPGTPGSLNLFSGGSNRASPYSPVPIVLGRMRITPPLTSYSILEATEASNFINMNLCWGVGPIFVDEATLMVGGVSFEDYTNSPGSKVVKYTVDNGAGVTDAATEEGYKTLFKTDFKQTYPNQEITADYQVGIPGPWFETVLEDPTESDESKKFDSIAVTLHFPEGLRKVITGGNDAGSSETTTAEFELQYAKKIPNSNPVQYAAFTSDGVGEGLSTALSSSRTFTFRFNDYTLINATGEGDRGYRWIRFGLYNNNVIIIPGALSDTLNGDPSQSLTNLYSSEQYSYLLGNNSTTSIKPDFSTGVFPLASIYLSLTNTATQTTIEYHTTAGTTKTGLTVTLADFSDENGSGISVTISSGSIRTTNNASSIISFTENRKDAFNKILPLIEVPAGEYKVRIRRTNLAETEVSDNHSPSAGLSNPYFIVPTTGYLGFSANFITAKIGDDPIEYVGPNVTLNKRQWKITGITTDKVTLSSNTPQILEGSGNCAVTIANLSAVDASVQGGAAGTLGTVTYTVEMMGGDGSLHTKVLQQKIARSALYPSVFMTDIEGLDFIKASPNTRGITVRFYRSTTTQQPTGDRELIPVNTYYVTMFDSTMPEPATATLLSTVEPVIYKQGNITGSITHEYSCLINGTNIIVNRTSAPANNEEYTYKIRLYVDAQKSQLLDEAILTVRYIQGNITPYRNFSKAILYTVTGYSSKKKDIYIAPKYRSGNTLVPVKIARTALRLESSSKINGQVDGVNAMVQSYGYNWTPTNPATSLTVGSWNTQLEGVNNPASLFLYVLMHPANAKRINASTPAEAAAYVDIDTIKEWHYFCKQNNFTYNYVLENISSVMDVLKDICAAGRASPLLKDGKWSVVIDKPKTEVIQHFTPHNSWGFESTRIIPKLPDAMRCVIRDEQNGYQDREIIVYNLGKNNETAELYEEITLPGITNEATARKHIAWNLAQLNHRPERYVLNTDFEYLVCNRGDRVKVVHDVPLWGTGSGRMAGLTISGSTRQFNTDDPILLETGTTYVVRTRLANGNFELGSLSVAETGYYTNLSYTLTQAGNIAPEDGNLFLIGETDTAINDLIVLSIESLNNKSARLILTDYSPSIFTEDHNTLYGNITSPIPVRPPENLVGSIVITPASVTFNSGEALASSVSPSTISYNISISVQHPEQVPQGIDGIEVEYVTSDSTITDTSNVPRYKFNLYQPIILTDVRVGQEYKIRLRYTGTNNRTGPWMKNGVLDYFLHTVQANSIYDDRPDAIEVDLDRSNLFITISRTTNVPSNFSHYEVRILKDPDSVFNGDFWEDGDNTSSTLYPDIYKATSVTGQFGVSLLNFSRPRLDPDGVMYRIACRSVDTNGNTSKSSLIRSYLLTPLT